MRKRALGKTGIQVSEIAFGGVEIGLPYGIGVESKSDMLSQSEAIQLLHVALEQGINFFDTARLYGDSENIMGKAFSGKRHEVIIATKCTHFRDSDGKLPATSQIRKIIERSLKESLAALKTSYVDIFMLHQADQEILENDEIATVFASLKQQGVIRATGASTYSTLETRLAIQRGTWDVIQLPFNLMDQRQSECFEEAENSGVGLVVRSVLLKGLLSDRGRNLHEALAEVEKHILSYHTMTGEQFPDLPTLATQFALSFGSISSVLVGIDKMDYLFKALSTANGQYMSAETLDHARALAYPDPAFLNLPYWDRMGWLK
jgi:aryl-alcohol dehydrogenase-like predicted oxidoreductase